MINNAIMSLIVKRLNSAILIPDGICDIPCGAIYPDGCDMSLRDEKRNLYHIATEQSGVISHLRNKYIARTE